MEKIQVYGSVPQPRFGQTMTLVSKTKAVMFGGATGDTGRYSITGETFTFDITNRYWKKIETSNNNPSPRAAHAAAAVEQNQLVLYGGATGGGGLAADDLYILDLKNGDDKAEWSIVPVVGTTPGRRYGHIMTYAKPFLVVFGGNTGTEPVNDFWCLNVEKSPFIWARHEPKSDAPSPRVYHSGALCQTGTATGMIVIYGGRGNDQVATNDSWGLRRHRNGTWDWVKAPYKPDKPKPTPRHQHSATFLGSAMIILGGRTNSPTESAGMETYDTETSEWYKTSSSLRFRHASWLLENYIYMFGGFEHDSPNIPTDTLMRINLLNVYNNNEALLLKAQAVVSTSPKQFASQDVSPSLSPQNNASSMNNTSGRFQFQQNNESFVSTTTTDSTQSTRTENRPPQSIFTISSPQLGGNNCTLKPGINQAIKARIDDPKNSYQQTPTHRYLKLSPQEYNVHSIFLKELLRPQNVVYLGQDSSFPFKSELIISLCDQAQAIIEQQRMVLRLQSPIKVFGDIHGQYSDLMRFFDLWGTPSDGKNDGDIEGFDYLFLGDFVDRGSHSLETICLLLAMKIRYPDQIHLIRGNHEDKWINNGFGFSDECANRLGEDPGDIDSVFNRINRLFEYFPLAAVIDDRVLCLHGGIGSSLKYVEQIDTLERPLEVIHEVQTPQQQLVVDILWSDPTECDEELGILPNEMRDPGRTGNIVKFGPDEVEKFLQRNNLSLIIRAHECVMDGFERFAGGKLITVFSATDYCGRHKNAGAVLILKKNSEIIPKMIYPQLANHQNWIEDEEQLKKRPPTPPRWKNNAPRKSSFE